VSIGAQCGELLQQRGRGIAIGIERDGDRHQLLLHLPVGRLGGNLGDMHRQAARRGKGRCDRRSFIGQSLRLEACCQGGGEGSPSFFSALGGSSSTKSSTRRFFVPSMSPVMHLPRPSSGRWGVLRSEVKKESSCPQGDGVTLAIPHFIGPGLLRQLRHHFGAIGKPSRARLSR
jgi:hypothetical protein